MAFILCALFFVCSTFSAEASNDRPRVAFTLMHNALISTSLIEDEYQQKIDVEFQHAYEKLEREKSILLRLQGARLPHTAANNFLENYTFTLNRDAIPTKKLAWHAIVTASAYEIIQNMPQDESENWATKIAESGINNLHSLYAYMKLKKIDSLDSFFISSDPLSDFLKKPLLQQAQKYDLLRRKPDGTWYTN